MDPSVFVHDELPDEFGIDSVRRGLAIEDPVAAGLMTPLQVQAHLVHRVACTDAGRGCAGQGRREVASPGT